jgi:hypothetical protein
MDYPPTERTDRRFVWITLSIAAVMLIVALAVALDIGAPADDDLPEGEFLAQGDEICSRARDEFERLQRTKPRTPGEAEELTSALVDLATEELDRVRELSAPADLEPALDRYLKAREQGIEQMRAGLQATRDRDAFAYEKAQAEVADGQIHRLQLAKQVGFSECSQILGERDQLANDAKPPAETTPQGAPPTIADPPTGAP